MAVVSSERPVSSQDCLSILLSTQAGIKEQKGKAIRELGMGLALSSLAIFLNRRPDVGLPCAVIVLAAFGLDNLRFRNQQGQVTREIEGELTYCSGAR